MMIITINRKPGHKVSNTPESHNYRKVVLKCGLANGIVRSFLTILFFAIFGSSCSAPQSTYVCDDAIGCVTITLDSPIEIGVIQALTGKIAPLGVEQIRGLELALEMRNNKILGHEVSLQTEDTGCSSEGGANAVLKVIANPQTIAIFGTTCSGAAKSVSFAMSNSGLTMISGNNSAPFLTSAGGIKAPDNHPGYFRVSYNEEKAAKAAAIFTFYKLGIRKVATIHDGDIYTKGLAEGFKKIFEAFGGKIVLASSVNKGDTNMNPLITAILRSNAELIFFPLFQPEANHLLIQARKRSDIDNIVMMGTSALIEQSFLNSVGEAGKYMYLVGPQKPTGAKVEAVFNAYREKYHKEPSTHYFLFAYDAANLLLNAIEASSVSKSFGPLYIKRQLLRDSLYAVRRCKGVTGELSCDEFGDCSTPLFNILRLDNPSSGLFGLSENVIFTYPSSYNISNALSDKRLTYKNDTTSVERPDTKKNTDSQTTNSKKVSTP